MLPKKITMDDIRTIFAIDNQDLIEARLSTLSGTDEFPQLPINETDYFKDAAVLIPIYEQNGELGVLLTKRTDTLKHHPGQVSFPGGSVEDIDESAIDAALREAEEEICLNPKDVEILSSLGTWPTVSGFRIKPYIGLISSAVEFDTLQACPHEVDEIIKAPLDFVLDKSNHKKLPIDYKGKQFNTFSIDYNNNNIWGFTAGALVLISKLIATSCP